MTRPDPITPRAAYVATVLLDTRAGGRYIDRSTWKRIAVPIPPTAARVAARLTDAVGAPITADEVRAGHLALKSAVPTYELRAIAAAAPTPQETTR